MNLVKIDCLDSYLPMIDRWIEHNDTTPDSFAEGRKLDTRSILMDESNEIDFFSIHAYDLSSQPVGIVAHSSKGEFLEGVMLWIEPEFRVKVSLNEIFNMMLEFARTSGKSGLRFESKIWGNSPTLLGFDLVGKKQDGEDIVSVWQKLVEEV